MFNPDSLIPAATASLYALEHRDIVKDNFSSIFSLLVESFRDDAFIARLHKLGPKGTITCSIKLHPKLEVLCFADKLWFNVKKSSSRYVEAYYVSIGVSLKSNKFNFTPYKKFWITNIAAGPIENIQNKLSAPELEENICNRLSEHVYNSIYNSVNEVIMG